MYLSRPRFRLWRIVLTLLLAYAMSGVFYGLGREVKIWATFPFDWLDLFIGPMFVAGTAFATVFTLGFPIIDVDTNERTNLYPIIIPTAVVLLAFATGVIRFGTSSAKNADKTGSQPAQPE